jgi:serine/threonine protein kinase
MKSEEWNQIDELFQQALNLAPGERAAFLNRRCYGKEHLRQQVESLLAHHEQSDSFLEHPPGEIAAELLTLERSRFQAGQFIGHYQVVQCVGAGGMGEVYRARDLKLKREVAVKILPEEFSRDVDRVSRFQREAEVLASLNHPNIANIYHLEEQNTSRYLVLELVEGETLAERIARGPIPVDEALPFAHQIAEALEAAHEKGIIHRDLKPANIKITTDGKVKVLDFGLAKAMVGQASNGTLSNSPMMLSGKIVGMILGTAAYMSPEQARGREADQRSDIFSFGCVLYEMFTGSQAFQGESVSDVLASVMKIEPDFDRLPKNINPKLYEVVRRCLVKSPRDRWYAIGDVRVELERLIADPVGLVSPSVAVSHAFRRLRFITAALIVVLIAALVSATLYFLRAPEEKTAIRLEMSASGIQQGRFPVAISPDGQNVSYSAQGEGKSSIWIRPIGEDQARPLAGTEGGRAPFWSPDSRYIAFFANGELKRISIAGGGPATTLTDTLTDTGVVQLPGTWNRHGVILFTAQKGPFPGIFRISELGGAVTPVISGSNATNALPQFLPDGVHFLYVSTAIAIAELYAGSLDGETPVRIMSIGVINGVIDPPGRYAAPGYLLFVREGMLTAQRFDEKRLALVGDPVLLAEPAGPFSVSTQQTVIYQPSHVGPPAQQIVWFDRTGKRGPSIETPGGIVGTLRLSGDGHRLAVDPDIGGSADIWVIDLDGGVPNKLTFDPAADSGARWSPMENELFLRLRGPALLECFSVHRSVSASMNHYLPKLLRVCRTSRAIGHQMASMSYLSVPQLVFSGTPRFGPSRCSVIENLFQSLSRNRLSKVSHACPRTAGGLHTRRTNSAVLITSLFERSPIHA